LVVRFIRDFIAFAFTHGEILAWAAIKS